MLAQSCIPLKQLSANVRTKSLIPCHIQLRTKSQIWHKENLLNIGMSRLPHDWKYVAWIDCDVLFARPDWVEETIHQLQHFHVVQMFSHMQDLDPQFGLAPQFYNALPTSWAYCYANGIPNKSKKNHDYGLNTEDETGKHYWHPGFAWAARREAIDHLGGLLDHLIVGGADYLMAIGLTGVSNLPSWTHYGASGRMIQEWKARADKHIQGNVGYVPGLLLHNWHGRKAQRQYTSRWDIVKDNNYDPDKDLKRDWQGLWQLTDRNPKLRDDIRNYMRSRNEDCIDVI
jgi:hypothetical protein